MDRTRDGGDSALDAGRTKAHPPESCAPEPVPEGSCIAPDYSEDHPLTPFSSLSARVVDSKGAPIANLLAQACGINLCLTSTTGVDGRVTIESEQQLSRPAFKYGLGLQYVKFARLLDPSETDHTIGEQVTTRLPDLEQGQSLRAGCQSQSNGVTLDVPDGAEIDVDTLTYTNELEQTFRAVRVPLDPLPDAVDPSFDFELVYGLSPIGTTFCPRARLGLPNTAGFDPGTALEVFVHGVDITEPWAPYGGWAKVSDATVSDDGERIVTDDTGGLPLLTVVALRRKQ